MLKAPTPRSFLMAFSFIMLLFPLLSACGASGSGTSQSSTPVKGGTWIDDVYQEPSSFITNGPSFDAFAVNQTLWAPLFYGDSQGAIHPGLVTEIPTVANGDISADLKTWTFKLRPGLLWSDGQPLNADDVDFSWKLWTNPKFPAASTIGFNLITSAEVATDKLSITFHLSAPFSPFISIWTDGFVAPLPKHHFAGIAPDKILNTPDNLNPSVTSGPFMMSESKPGDHYTLVRNPHYYRASEGLPYLDKLVLRIVPNLDTVLKDLQAGSVTSAYRLDVTKRPTYEQLTNYHLVHAPFSGSYENIYFDFHNPILGKELTVRKAIAMAIDHQALINTALRGVGSPQCTDHSKAYNPGYQADAPCPTFDPAAASALLEQNGWTKGPDGVRTKGDQRLEFQYSAASGNPTVTVAEEIIQANLQAIGIKINIHNYPSSTLDEIQAAGKPGQYDIVQFGNLYDYDADDANSLSCSQFPPNGYNTTFYCNPALDKLYAQEEATTDPAARQQIFNQIHQIYLTDFPIIILYGKFNLGIAKKTTRNFLPGPFSTGDTVNVWDWWCDGGHC
ncbi:MAG: peptide ABC transporter substrate-binding protein [Ktedonobacteraceae bacterium]|nr:peptide ABC transporter substrate-binding protein [Ktedonobacteraceae bacterium]